MDLSDIVIASTTHSAEQIKQVYADQGYEVTDVEELSDEPVAEPVEPPENPEPTTDKADKASSVPTPQPGAEDAAEEGASETGAESDPAQTEEQEPAQPAQHKKRPGGWERKIQKKDAEIGALKSETEELRKRLAATEKPAAPKTVEPEPEKEKPAKAAEEPKPKIEDFESGENPYEDWIEAVQRWSVRDELRRHEDGKRAAEEAARKQEEETTQREAQERTREILEKDREAFVERWNAQLEESRALHEDFDEVLNSDVPATPAMASALGDLPQGTELAYWLGTHPEEAARIAQITALPKGMSTENAPPTVVRKLMYTAYTEFNRIQALLAADQTAPETPATARATQAVPERRASAAATTPVQTQAPPRAKATPVTPVGSRGAMVRKSPIDLAQEGEQVDPNLWRAAREGKLR